MNPQEIAQWVINNRYPRGENDKVSDHEMYTTIVESVNKMVFAQMDKLFSMISSDERMDILSGYCRHCLQDESVTGRCFCASHYDE